MEVTNSVVPAFCRNPSGFFSRRVDVVAAERRHVVLLRVLGEHVGPVDFRTRATDGPSIASEIMAWYLRFSLLVGVDRTA